MKKDERKVEVHVLKRHQVLVEVEGKLKKEFCFSKTVNPSVLLKPIEILPFNHFKTIERDRLAGSTFSSGFVEDEKKKIYVCKCNVVFDDPYGIYFNSEKTWSSNLCEKIGSDIYEYFGCVVPQTYLSPQRLKMRKPKKKEEGVFKHFEELKRSIEFDCKTPIHILSEYLEDYQDFCKIINFEKLFYKNGKDLFIRFYDTLCVENQIKSLTLKGLGKVLAVSLFVNDVDTLGGSGKNLGFIVENNTMQIVKIDPGYSFPYNIKTGGIVEFSEIKNKVIQVSTGGLLVKFDDLQTHLKHEFLMTLQDIIRTNEAIIRGMFFRKGSEKFIVYDDRSVDLIVKSTLNRIEQIKKVYKRELSDSLEDYIRKQENIQLTSDISEKRWQQQQLHFYVETILFNKEKMKDEIKGIGIYEAVDKFLNSKIQKVMLISGDAGSGKSISLLDLSVKNSKKRRVNKQNYVVLHFFLRNFDQKSMNCIMSYIQKNEKTLLLLDGYDEIISRDKPNIFKVNQLWEYLNVRVIITCRSDYLESLGSVSYQNYFFPYTNYDEKDENGLIEYEISKFSTKQIEIFLLKYCKEYPHTGGYNKVKKNMEHIEGLNELITNPFILRIMVDALPNLLRKRKKENKEMNRIIRNDIYTSFISMWFERNGQRINATRKEIEGFQRFSENIALKMYKERIVTIKQSNNENDYWSKIFNSKEQSVQRAVVSCPLVFDSSNNSYSFVHKSFLEYFICCILLKIMKDLNEFRENSITPNDIVSDKGVIGFLDEILNNEHPIIKELNITNPRTIKELLLQWMYKSRKDKTYGDISSVSITILNVCNTPFSLMDLSNISICNSVLNCSIFDSTNLLNSDLSNCTFKSSIMYSSNFSSCKMSDVEFGELSCIKLDDSLLSLCLVENKYLFCGVGSHIVVCDLEKNNEIVKTLNYSNRHDVIRSIVYEKSRKMICISSGKFIVLRDFSMNNEIVLIIENIHHNSKSITCVDFKKKFITSIGNDKTINIYEISKEKKTYNVLRTIKRKEGTGVKFVDDKEYRLICGCKDGIIYIWNETLKLVKKLYFDNTPIGCMDFNKNYLICGNNGIIKVWKLINSNFENVKTIHSKRLNITSIKLNSNTTLFGCGSKDNYVLLYNLNSCELLNLVKGHKDEVLSLIFYKNYLISAGGYDKTIRFLEIKDYDGGTTDNIEYVGYTKLSSEYSFSWIRDLCFYPVTFYLVATLSNNGELMIWNINNGKIVKILSIVKGNKHLAVSSCERYLVTGNEKIQIFDIKSDYILLKENSVGSRRAHDEFLEKYYKMYKSDSNNKSTEDRYPINYRNRNKSESINKSSDRYPINYRRYKNKFIEVEGGKITVKNYNRIHIVKDYPDLRFSCLSVNVEKGLVICGCYDGGLNLFKFDKNDEKLVYIWTNKYYLNLRNNDIKDCKELSKNNYNLLKQSL